MESFPLCCAHGLADCYSSVVLTTGEEADPSSWVRAWSHASARACPWLLLCAWLPYQVLTGPVSTWVKAEPR